MILQRHFVISTNLYPEEAGNAVRNKFGQNFKMVAKSMMGLFWFDSFDSNVVEVAAKDVQKLLENYTAGESGVMGYLICWR